MKLVIASGGQTGADRGGFDAAIQLGLEYTGWAPKGWRAEDGIIPPIYRDHMRESVSAEYGLRTRLNVQDSRATLLVSFAEQLTRGSLYTSKCCRQMARPSQHLVLPAGKGVIPDGVRDALQAWLKRLVDDNGGLVLNVAGPRESREPGIQAAVRQALVWMLGDVVAEDLREHTEVLEEFARAIHAVGERPDRVAINPANVEVALAAGLDVDIVPDPKDSDAPLGTFVVPQRKLYETDPVASAFAGIARSVIPTDRYYRVDPREPADGTIATPVLAALERSIDEAIVDIADAGLGYGEHYLGTPFPGGKPAPGSIVCSTCGHASTYAEEHHPCLPKEPK